MRFAIALVTALLSSAATAEERILVPVTGTQEPGAYGSVWTTALWAQNLGNDVIFLRPTGCGSLPVCPGHTPLDPGVALPLYVPGTPAGLPPGRILTAERSDGTAPAPDTLFVSLRVRDESRTDSSMGVEIPLIREGELFSTPLALLNIPGDARFRHTLRIYDIENRAIAFRIRLLPEASRLAVAEQTAVLTVNTDPDGYVPSAVQMDLRPMVPAGDGRYSLLIEPLQETKYWAFMSITNNETQEVTITTPGT